MLLMENVKALVQSKFIRDFHKLQRSLEDIGYKNFTQVLDSSRFGTPQHRERTFMVSILRTEDNPEPQYHFPAPFPLERCLADVLEEEVDESLYLSDEMLSRFCTKSIEESESALSDGNLHIDDYDDGFDNFLVCG